jgi:hypothetical protein
MALRNISPHRLPVAVVFSSFHFVFNTPFLLSILPLRGYCGLGGLWLGECIAGAWAWFSRSKVPDKGMLSRRAMSDVTRGGLLL